MKKLILRLMCILCISRGYAMPNTVVVEPKQNTSTIQYDGHLFATRIIEVQSPGNATLIKSHVNFGDKVSQHQLLFEFVSQELQTQLAEANMTVLENQEALTKLQSWSKSYETLQAVSHFEKAKNERDRTKLRYEQTKTLYQKGIIAKEECLMDERIYKDSQQYLQNAQRQLAQIQDKASQTALLLAASKLEQAKQKRDLLQQKLNHLRVLSPIEGTLLAPVSSDNKQVMPFYPQKVFQGPEVIAWVADLSQLCIVVKVDEFDIVRLHKDQSAQITFAAFPKQTLQGHIKEIVHQNNVSARESREVMAYDVKVALSAIPREMQDKLLMGMSAKVALEESKPQGLWISKMAVIYENDEPYVNKVNAQSLVKQKVVLGDSAQNEVLVLSGLVSGDKIVIHG